MIHPTAIIDPKAELHETVFVGPYTVIDSGVRVDAGCEIGPHAHLAGETKLGKNNRIHAGAVIGDAPQDLKYTGEPTRLRIGDDNVIREHVTLHRSNSPDEDTVIGNQNFFMAHSHVGHNAVVGDHNIFANGALVSNVLLFVGGGLLMSSNSIMITLAQELAPENSGLASSLPLGFSWGLASLTLPVIGYFGDQIGVAETLKYLALLPILTAGLAFFLPSRPSAKDAT